MRARDLLAQGMSILAETLGRAGFHATRVEEGVGSGGEFATVRFIRDDRALELHFRQSLGLVRYHAGPHHVTHEYYMRVVSPQGNSAYPGFSTDPLEAFSHLNADLTRFGFDFLAGDASALRRAAGSEREHEEEANRRLRIEAVGDGRQRRAAREEFRNGNFRRAVSLLSDLKYPDDLSLAEKRMLEIARQRA